MFFLYSFKVNTRDGIHGRKKRLNKDILSTSIMEAEKNIQDIKNLSSYSLIRSVVCDENGIPVDPREIKRKKEIENETL